MTGPEDIEGFLERAQARGYVTVEELHALLAVGASATEIENLLVRLDELQVELLEQVPDPVEPLDPEARTNLRETTKQVLASLTPREQRVLRVRFGIGVDKDQSLDEVGRQFSVTREHIRRIEARALAKLRKPRRSEGSDYAFRPVTPLDLPTMARWLRRPHVAEWWSDPEEQIETLRRNFEKREFDALVMLLNGRPLGYLQVYDASPAAEGASGGGGSRRPHSRARRRPSKTERSRHRPPTTRVDSRADAPVALRAAFPMPRSGNPPDPHAAPSMEPAAVASSKRPPPRRPVSPRRHRDFPDPPSPRV